MLALIEPTLSHSEQFIAAVERSTTLHEPWVSPPSTEAEFALYLEKISKPKDLGFLVVEGSELLGVVNVNEIVMGSFCSGYLGFYSFLPNARNGHLKSALTSLVSMCFENLGFNRLEANVQPSNYKSLNLVKSLGFKKEGFSENYLKIRGEWRDHERWAILKMHWQTDANA